MAKPKAKSAADNDLLSQMLKKAEVANHSALAPASANANRTFNIDEPDPDAPSAPAEPTPQRVEQKEENDLAAPAANSLPLAAMQPEPAPTAAVVSTSASATEAALVSNQATAPVEEPSSAATPESVATVVVPVGEEPMNYDLASLFKRSGEKKTFSVRIPDRHYQYLLLLGTIVGAGVSPPEIIYNLVEQFIEKHDAQVQKAIHKHMRQRMQAAKR